MRDQQEVQIVTSDTDAGEWLRSCERTIIPPWIAEIKKTTNPSQQGLSTRQMESAELINLFDNIVRTIQTGHTPDLDVAIQELVSNRLGQGYSLTDFLYIAGKLKSAIWQTAIQSLPAADALSMLQTMEPVFSYSMNRLAWLTNRFAQTQLQEELERMRHTLAKLDRTKSDFISIAAHELKTPLTLLQGYASILSSELADNNNALQIFDGLTSGIKRLQSLIQDMIDVSLIDSDVLTLSVQTASLYEIVRLALGDLEQEAVGRSLTIHVDRFPDEMDVMYLDARRMYQVFINLLGNAIKYTPDGGVIRVEAEVLRSRDQDKKFAKISISDSGIGIAVEDLQHIFDKFYRVGDVGLHSTSKTQFKGGGPGLGLSIAKGIIEAHSGRIWAESRGVDAERCPGSVFYVMLPINKAKPKSASERLLEFNRNSR
jgi:signal transduction histidine kinase